MASKSFLSNNSTLEKVKIVIQGKLAYIFSNLSWLHEWLLPDNYIQPKIPAWASKWSAKVAKTIPPIKPTDILSSFANFASYLRQFYANREMSSNTLIADNHGDRWKRRSPANLFAQLVRRKGAKVYIRVEIDKQVRLSRVGFGKTRDRLWTLWD